jgi:uncharacterized protein DUF2442
MNSSVIETSTPLVHDVRVSQAALEVRLDDGRVLSVPLAWYPRLAHGSSRERRQWRIIGAGIGIHWPALDEDISVAGLLAGLPSGESATSLKRWLAARPPNTYQPSPSQERRSSPSGRRPKPKRRKSKRDR